MYEKCEDLIEFMKLFNFGNVKITEARKICASGLLRD
jgi:hypothetical protein